MISLDAPVSSHRVINTGCNLIVHNKTIKGVMYNIGNNNNNNNNKISEEAP